MPGGPAPVIQVQKKHPEEPKHIFSDTMAALIDRQSEIFSNRCSPTTYLHHGNERRGYNPAPGKRRCLPKTDRCITRGRETRDKYPAVQSGKDRKDGPAEISGNDNIQRDGAVVSSSGSLPEGRGFESLSRNKKLKQVGNEMPHTNYQEIFMHIGRAMIVE